MFSLCFMKAVNPFCQSLAMKWPEMCMMRGGWRVNFSFSSSAASKDHGSGAEGEESKDRDPVPNHFHTMRVIKKSVVVIATFFLPLLLQMERIIGVEEVFRMILLPSIFCKSEKGRGRWWEGHMDKRKIKGGPKFGIVVFFGGGTLWGNWGEAGRAHSTCIHRDTCGGQI